MFMLFVVLQVMTLMFIMLMFVLNFFGQKYGF
jgi:hypothetical protein